MGIKNARHSGRMKIKGRPTDVAKAEIMVMKHEGRTKKENSRRRFFTALDFIIIASFGLAIYSIWIKEYVNMILFAAVGTIPLIYFIIRRILKNNSNPQYKRT